MYIYVKNNNLNKKLENLKLRTFSKLLTFKNFRVSFKIFPMNPFAGSTIYGRREYILGEFKTDS